MVLLIYFFKMASELELLQIAISHLKEDVEELQTDHEWCIKMNEAVENSYIPIPKIDLNTPINMHLKMKNVIISNTTEYSCQKQITFTKKPNSASVSLEKVDTIIFAIKYQSRLIFGAVYIAKGKIENSNLECKINGQISYLHFLSTNRDFYYSILRNTDFKDNNNKSMDPVSINDFKMGTLRSNLRLIEIGLSKYITFSEQFFNNIYFGPDIYNLQKLQGTTDCSSSAIVIYLTSWAAYDLKMFIITKVKKIITFFYSSIKIPFSNGFICLALM